MKPFDYRRVDTVAEALEAVAHRGTVFLAGGTNLMDLMYYSVEEPSALVDINHLGLADVERADDGGLRIGALVRNTDLANHPLVRADYPLLSQAVLSGASTQLRNRATVGGNLLQRTRCYYFVDAGFPACNKRRPGSGCGAIGGQNRIHAILGQTDEGAESGESCIAVNPSDMSVALAALAAVVEIEGPDGRRDVPIGEFHLLPGSTPWIETVLRPDELITGVRLPPPRFAQAYYLKARDRTSYAYALVSVAAGLEIEDGVIRAAGLALGGVAPKPWRVPEAEAALVGRPAADATYGAAADLVLRGAKGYAGNRFKISMARLCILRALDLAAGQAGP